MQRSPMSLWTLSFCQSATGIVFRPGLRSEAGGFDFCQPRHPGLRRQVNAQKGAQLLAALLKTTPDERLDLRVKLKRIRLVSEDLQT